MHAARAKAPTLAWLLTALTCFLAGIALAEGGPPAGGVAPAAPPIESATVAVAAPPTATPTSTPPPTPTPSPAILRESS